MKSRSCTDQPARSSAASIARDGWECSEVSGPATWPGAPTTARYSRPWRSAYSRLVRTTAAAPSESGEELPAVIVPSFANAGRSLAMDSALESGRTPWSVSTTSGSPLRCGTDTGAISSRKTPSSAARAARWWLRAATWSCSSREIERSLLPDSVSEPMDTHAATSTSPSLATASSSLRSP